MRWIQSQRRLPIDLVICLDTEPQGCLATNTASPYWRFRVSNAFLGWLLGRARYRVVIPVDLMLNLILSYTSRLLNDRISLFHLALPRVVPILRVWSHDFPVRLAW